MGKLLTLVFATAIAVTATACDRKAASPERAQAGAPALAMTASQAGDPNPAMQDPDRVGWSLFVAAVAPAGGSGTTFETWATDADTFNAHPSFPTGPSHALHARVIPAVARAGLNLRAVRPHLMLEAQGIHTLEDVHRNRPAFEFIVRNNLFTIQGLKANFGKALSFDKNSIEVKTNWVAVADIPAFTNNKVTAAQVSQYFYVSKDASNTAWALVAMHVISKQVPNWTWATFENRWNPARCDIIGCHDSFGATIPAVNSNAQPNQGYGACDQTGALQQMFSTAGVAAVFGNYCLKGSQTDFTDDTGLSIRLGNSITEAGQVQDSSCMTCHGQASWDQQGIAKGFAFVIGPIDTGVYWQYSGSGRPYPGMPGLVRKATSADFVWAIPFCAGDATTNDFPCAPQTKAKAKAGT